MRLSSTPKPSRKSCRSSTSPISATSHKPWFQHRNRMFAKGSRYRNLPESSPVDADGERKRGKQLRLIAQPESQFLHAVQEKDRLDLLAYKYYGDPTRWWQIADANAAPE